MKNVCCWKKITWCIVLQCKIIITKYLNIELYSLGTCKVRNEVVVNNGGCITSHNKRGEKAFYAKYTGK